MVNDGLFKLLNKYRRVAQVYLALQHWVLEFIWQNLGMVIYG